MCRKSTKLFYPLPVFSPSAQGKPSLWLPKAHYGCYFIYYCFYVIHVLGELKRTRLKSKSPKRKQPKLPHVLCSVTDEQTLWEKPSTPLVAKHIGAPNSSSLVSHDEFNEDLVGKVWLGPLSSGSSGIEGPRAPQIEESDEETSIIKQRREEMVKERERKRKQNRDRERMEETKGELQGTKQSE